MNFGLSKSSSYGEMVLSSSYKKKNLKKKLSLELYEITN